MLRARSDAQFRSCGHIEPACNPGSCSGRILSPARARAYAIGRTCVWNRWHSHGLAWRCSASGGQIKKSTECAPRTVVRGRAQATFCDPLRRNHRWAACSHVLISTRARRASPCVISKLSSRGFRPDHANASLRPRTAVHAAAGPSILPSTHARLPSGGTTPSGLADACGEGIGAAGLAGLELWLCNWSPRPFAEARFGGRRPLASARSRRLALSPASV